MNRKVLVGSAIVILSLLVTGVTFIATALNDNDDERFVSLEQPKTSPSGQFVASVELGPEQNGVKTWITVITDKSGVEVFRDDYAYSIRHGVGVTWISSQDQLWILSGDVGVAHVDRAVDETWSKTGITPETTHTIPDEIQQYLPH